MGLDVCVLEAQDDVYDDSAGTPTNLAGMFGVNTTDEDVVAPEVTEELNRLKVLGRPYTAPTVDELMPRGLVYSQRTNEHLDDRMVSEGRGRDVRRAGEIHEFRSFDDREERIGDGRSESMGEVTIRTTAEESRDECSEWNASACIPSLRRMLAKCDWQSCNGRRSGR